MCVVISPATLIMLKLILFLISAQQEPPPSKPGVAAPGSTTEVQPFPTDQGGTDPFPTISKEIKGQALPHQKSALYSENTLCVKEKIKMKMFGNGLVRCHVEHRLYLVTVSYLRLGDCCTHIYVYT